MLKIVTKIDTEDKESRLLDEVDMNGSQSGAYRLFWREETCPDKINVRATSPHVLSIQRTFTDRFISLSDEFNSVRMQLAPSSRVGTTFVFNAGLDILSKMVKGKELVAENVSEKILSCLKQGEWYSDYGDLQGQLSLMRLSEGGDLLMQVNNPEHPGIQKLCAVFSENALDAQGHQVDRRTMAGLWSLALGLKIQQNEKGKGKAQTLSMRGINSLRSDDLNGWSRMLLSLDA